MKNKKCICGSSDFIIKSFSINFNSSKCKKCNTINFIHKSKKITFDYSDKNDKYGDLNYLLGNDLRWAHKKILKYLNKNKSVLELGAYNGFYINELLKNNIDAIGFDINENAVKIGRKIYPKIKNKLFFDFSKIKNEYDYCLLIDVLEHIEEPKKFIKKYKNLIKKNGYLVISSPVEERVLHDKSDYPPHHPWWFSVLGLNKLLNECNFSVDKIFIQRDGKLLVRNFFGKILSGWKKNEFHGEIGFKKKNNFIQVILFLITRMLGPLVELYLKIFKKTYCSVLIFAKKN